MSSHIVVVFEEQYLLYSVEIQMCVAYILIQIVLYKVKIQVLQARKKIVKLLQPFYISFE